MMSVNPPSGFRDFLNEEARRRLKLMNVISSVYQSFGFQPLETPVLETLEVLQGSGGGEENEKLIFKILKRGDKLAEALKSEDERKIAEYGLRFDMTLPLSRAVASHRGEIKMPWKVLHMGPVWRAERPQKGRYREFIQCDVDIIGAKGIGAEIEVIQAAVTAVQKIGATGFELRINDRRLIQSLGEYFGFLGEKLEKFAVILDKKDKIPSSEVIQQLADLLGHEVPQDLLPLIEGKGDLDSVEKFHPDAVKNLRLIVSTLKSLDLPLNGIVFDPSLVRGMGYYTGPVFELRHSSAGYSFGGGGRYDKLIGRFSGQDIPACGFSLGFERLALLLAENEREAQENSPVLFVPVFGEELRPHVLKLASQLRNENIEVDVFPDQAKIKNQFKFASEFGYRWVLIIGDEEWSSQVFKLKDFKAGTEQELPMKDLISKLKDLCTK